MFKITAIVSLVLIGNMLASSFSCDSCGSECAAACGTRHFRSCCFNYLRRKRGPDNIKISTQNRNLKADKFQRRVLPIIVVEEMPEQWIEDILSSDFKPYILDDTTGNRLDSVYDM